MGKDNITFHSQIWPAELLAANGQGSQGRDSLGSFGELQLAHRGGLERVPDDGVEQVLVVARPRDLRARHAVALPARCVAVLHRGRRSGDVRRRLHVGGVQAPHQRRAGGRVGKPGQPHGIAAAQERWLDPRARSTCRTSTGPRSTHSEAGFDEVGRLIGIHRQRQAIERGHARRGRRQQVPGRHGAVEAQDHRSRAHEDGAGRRRAARHRRQHDACPRSCRTARRRCTRPSAEPASSAPMPQISEVDDLDIPGRALPGDRGRLLAAARHVAAQSDSWQARRCRLPSPSSPSLTTIVGGAEARADARRRRERLSHGPRRPRRCRRPWWTTTVISTFPTAEPLNAPPAQILDEAAAVGVTRAVQIGCDIDSARWTAEAIQADVAAGRAASRSTPTRRRCTPQASTRVGSTTTRRFAEISRLARVPRMRVDRRDGPRLPPHRARGARGAGRGPFGTTSPWRRSWAWCCRSTIATPTRTCSTFWSGTAHPSCTVFHCFSGDAAMARVCAYRGYYVSFAGNVTFKNAASLRAALAVTPLEQRARGDGRARSSRRIRSAVESTRPPRLRRRCAPSPRCCSAIWSGHAPPSTPLRRASTGRGEAYTTTSAKSLAFAREYADVRQRVVDACLPTRENVMTYRTLPPAPGGRRERRLRARTRLRTYRQLGTTLWSVRSLPRRFRPPARPTSPIRGCIARLAPRRCPSPQ